MFIGEKLVPKKKKKKKKNPKTEQSKQTKNKTKDGGLEGRAV